MISLENQLGNKNEEAVSIDYSFKSFLKKAKEGEPLKKIFGDYFHTGELCFLGGKPGVGKSTLAYTIADGIARGESILGQPNEAGQQNVIYYDFEMGEKTIQNRYEDYDPPETFFRPDMNEWLANNNYRFDFGAVGRDVEQYDLKVVIIDNITGIEAKCTQDQQAALDIMKAAIKLKREKNISILILMHTTKQKEQIGLQTADLEGSAKLVNLADSCIIVDKSARNINERYVKQGKSRNAMEKDKVLTVEVVSKKWLHHEFTGYEYETALLFSEAKRQSDVAAKRAKLLEIATRVLGGGCLPHNDFCKKYAKIFGQTFDSGKKKLQLLIRNNIVSQQSDKTYIINNEEESESLPAEEEPD